MFSINTVASGYRSTQLRLIWASLPIQSLARGARPAYPFCSWNMLMNGGCSSFMDWCSCISATLSVTTVVKSVISSGTERWARTPHFQSLISSSSTFNLCRILQQQRHNVFYNPEQSKRGRTREQGNRHNVRRRAAAPLICNATCLRHGQSKAR